MAEGFPPLLIWASTTMRLSRRLYRRLLVPADHRFHLDVCGFLSETPSRHNMTWSVLWSRIVCLEIEKYIENYRNILILIIYIYIRKSHWCTFFSILILTVADWAFQSLTASTGWLIPGRVDETSMWGQSWLTVINLKSIQRQSWRSIQDNTSIIEFRIPFII